MLEVLVRVPAASGTKVFPIECNENDLVWHLKIGIFCINAIPPSKQCIFLQKDSKEVDNSIKVKSFFTNNGKPLVIMKPKKTDEKRTRSNRSKKKVLRTGKKFREAVHPKFCFAGGRGTLRGVVGIPCSMTLQAIGSDFHVLLSKDGRMFEATVEKETTPERETPIIEFQMDEENSCILGSWIPEESGCYLVYVRVFTSEGREDIHGSPFSVQVIDHHDSGAEVKKMIYDKKWAVEAAQILAHWASNEEFHKEILEEVGMSSILDLLLSKQQSLVHPLLSLALDRLIQRDSTKIIIAKEGGISGLTALLQLDNYSNSHNISRFVSRTFAAIAQLVVAYCDSDLSENPSTRQIFHMCNNQFFCMISDLLNHADIETTRNCARALATFSSKENYLGLIAEVNMYPLVVELYENTNNDVSVRRSALTTLANFTTEISYCKKYFTDSRISNITKAICHPYTEDLLIADAVRALANLAKLEDFAGSILTNHWSTVETILQYTQGTDSQVAWEAEICLRLLPDSVDTNAFQSKFSHALRGDDNFNFEGVRLLANLLTNCHTSDLNIKLVAACKKTIPNIVRFIKSLNLKLQYVACQTIAILSGYEACRKEMVHIDALGALCSALNTCTTEATPHIVAALAQMPLNLKESFVNIIGDSGIEKLISLLKQSDNLQLQKDTAILLASLAGSEENRKIVNQGGAAFLRSLIDLVQKRKVNVETRISPDELIYDKVIGQGICGIVWKATWKDQVVAVKKFSEDSLAFSLEEFNSEVALMSVLRHENIVHCIGSCAEPENLYIVSELFEKGCVTDIVEDMSFDLKMSMVIHLALGAARGMKYLHQLGIIHRDLKNGNILVGSDWTAKVADFGLSRMMDSKMTRGVGTPIYTAPEALAGSEYSQKADVYSFAFVMWELVTREVPFADIPVFDAVLRASEEDLRPVIPPNCILEGIIASCWQKDPNLRPTFTEIVNVLSQLQLLVGTPEQVSGRKMAVEEDAEDQQYNYTEANEILCSTLRHSKSGEPTTKKKGSRTRKNDNKEKLTRPGRVESPAGRKREKRKSSRDLGQESREKKKSSRKIRRSLKDIGLFESSSLELIGSSEALRVAEEAALTPTAAPSIPVSTLSPSVSNAQRLRSTSAKAPINVCDQCSAPITGRSIKIENQNYHVECFVCGVCNKSLLQQSWCKFEGKPYCRMDYENLFAPKCSKCGNVLNEKYVNALDKNWHRECFVCFKCNAPLVKFEEVDGNPCCIDCADAAAKSI